MVNINDVKVEEIPTPTLEKDRLDLMFERQHGLAIKYLPIEKDNGLLQTEDFPVNLDDRRGQARLKDFAWRTLEELYEATDALVQHPDNPEHFLEEMIDSVHFFIEMNLLCGITPQKIRDYYSIPKKVLIVVMPQEETSYSDVMKYLETLKWDYLAIPEVEEENIDSFEYLEKVSNTIETFSAEEIKKIPEVFLIHITIGQCIGNAMNRLKNKPWKQTHMVTDKEAFYNCLMPAWIGYFRVLSHKYGLSANDIFTLYFKKSEVNKFRIRSGY